MKAKSIFVIFVNRMRRASLSLLFISTLLVISSCTSNVQEGILPDFTKVTDLAVQDSLDIESLNILNPLSIHYRKGFLVFTSTNEKDDIQLLDLNSGTVITKNIIGGAPDEVSVYGVVSTLSGSPKLHLADPNSKKILEFDMDSLSANQSMRQRLYYTFPRNVGIYNGFENSHYIYFNGLSDKGRVLCYNKLNGEITYYAEYPENEDIASLSALEKGLVFNGALLAGDESHLVIAQHGLIDFYSIGENGELHPVNHHYYFFPRFRIDPNLSVTFFRTDPKRFRAINADDNYIYVLYSGRTVEEYGMNAFSGNILLTYDWQGNPVCEYHLPISVASFTMVGDKIYGLNREGDPKVYIYELPD